MNAASLELRPGSPEKYMSDAPAGKRQAVVVREGEADYEGDTSYIGVIDKDRNMVSFEPSLHSSMGTGVVMGGTGILFNCRGDYYSLVRGEANALEPGKRPRSTLQSTLIMKDGEPFGILGSPGGDDQVMRTIQTLINVVDFGMNIQQAIESPRWSTSQFSVLGVSPHHATGRGFRRSAHPRGHAAGARGARAQAAGDGCVVAGFERGDHCGQKVGSAQPPAPTPASRPTPGHGDPLPDVWAKDRRTRA